MKKIIFLVLFSLLGWSQTNKSVKTALVIVDIQMFYFPNGSLPLVDPEKASLKAKNVLEVFRKQNLPVIHVQHQSKKEADIHLNVQPIDGEKIITKTEANSFAKTDLLDYLKSQKITRLIIVGMQTQMCVEATIRAGYDYGFECVMIEDACATRDLKYGEATVLAKDVHACTLATVRDGGYGRVITTENFIKEFKKYLF